MQQEVAKGGQYKYIQELQSLFCWKSLCNFVNGRGNGVEIVLQSLFCWKTLCNAHMRLLKRMQIFRYSPCFAGRPSATCNAETDTDTEKGYQVTVLVLLEDPLQL